MYIVLQLNPPFDLFLSLNMCDSSRTKWSTLVMTDAKETLQKLTERLQSLQDDVSSLKQWKQKKKKRKSHNSRSCDRRQRSRSRTRSNSPWKGQRSRSRSRAYSPRVSHVDLPLGVEEVLCYARGVEQAIDMVAYCNPGVGVTHDLHHGAGITHVPGVEQDTHAANIDCTIMYFFVAL